MRAFEMVLRVKAGNLTTVLDVLKDSADLISMKQIDDPSLTPKIRSRHTYRKRGDRVTAQSLMDQLLAPGNAVTKAEMVKAFGSNGFAKTSASPTVNKMIRSGRVKKLADGVYTKA